MVTWADAVIYGKAGGGKTTLAATWPKPILFMDFKEKGTDSIKNVKGVDVIPIESWSQIEDIYWLLKKKKKYKTIVWDTVTGAQAIGIREIITEHEQDVEPGEEGFWGSMPRRMWGKVSSKMTSIITDFAELEMNVVFIAHDRIFTFEDEGDDDDEIEPQVGPRVMPSVASVMNGSVGIICSCFIREKVRTIKKGKKRITKKKAQYCIRIGPHAYYITKVRKPIEREIPQVMLNPTYDKIKDLRNVD